MIVISTRIHRDGGVRYLASHLLDKVAENERIEILSGDRQALYDAHALASAKGCRYSIRHISISPERDMSPAQLSGFLRAVDTEFGVGRYRPRLIVRHIKSGRSHFHIAVSEVDPVSFRVLDCRNDYARLESIARHYEAANAETVQPARAMRRRGRMEGFSDIARKRAEHQAAEFDRTKLRTAFAKGRAEFNRELDRQGLHVAWGDKGHILRAASGTFVAAANRAVGVRRAEFHKFMKTEFAHEQLIGNPSKPAEHCLEHGNVCIAPPASSLAIEDARTARPARSVAGDAAPNSEHATAAGRRLENLRRTARSIGTSVGFRRRQEQQQLYQIEKVDLDNLLRFARELAAWMTSLFEPPTSRLIRQIADVWNRKLFPPDAPSEAAISSYRYHRRPIP